MSIEVRNLSFAYGSHEVLRDVSFAVPDAALVGVLGPNGVGKSTLFRCILGLNQGYRGTILVNGQDLRRLSVRERAREVSYIPQSHAPVYDYEVLDVVLMATGSDLKMLSNPGKAQVKRAYAALERIGIERLAHRAYTQISGGEQQLVLIARAIAQQAQTIIMDEPTSALDYGNTVRVLSCVRQLAREGLSIIQSTHNPDQAFLYSDKTLVIDGGRVRAFGSPHDTITSELISDLYAVDVEVNSLYGDKVRVCVPVREVQSR
ncbi:ABC transporter ATP-binding protein [Adlercreutzia faecimuris]|uniref:ABC transporter ATP-binding protein n=1 Tax=Adlercreutzia faecimuris TaxID=2897341 RepID=A0ABS9WE72_9ACTN|nr:ABC transporter ATP-binding protein [Adlercreutzia sp. JBNU-10]MCI2241169.1 ABC transporter ATP-binding protein [Adlercreutzia sp. JBNU-10]